MLSSVPFLHSPLYAHPFKKHCCLFLLLSITRKGHKFGAFCLCNILGLLLNVNLSKTRKFLLKMAWRIKLLISVPQTALLRQIRKLSCNQGGARQARLHSVSQEAGIRPLPGRIQLAFWPLLLAVFQHIFFLSRVWAESYGKPLNKSNQRIKEKTKDVRKPSREVEQLDLRPVA